METLIHESEVPLLVVPPTGRAPANLRIEKIVVPLDGSPFSELILPVARRLAEEVDAEILLTHVLGQATERNYSDIERRLEGLVLEIEAHGVRVRLKITMGGEADREIVRVAEIEDADAIAMSAHGYGAMRRIVFGGVAGRVVREAPVPVLVARARALKKLQAQASVLSS